VVTAGIINFNIHNLYITPKKCVYVVRKDLEKKIVNYLYLPLELCSKG